ncbi:hypothetical protein SADUNF_Sadunf16G0279600 [Salix dunnii]|uniref:BHLH domain-containing protein n=1 Tax=Salix dunnii TaxID=1413687 RepID=A0A835JC55_9ROSI|nr:hypothetical protein SADUNF_Sadunf16G0279600 [Salix dunnii]
MVSPGNAASLLDYDQYINMDELHIPAHDPNFSAFSWPPSGNRWIIRGMGRSESCSASSSKACREKLRRDRLNDKYSLILSFFSPPPLSASPGHSHFVFGMLTRFIELGSILEPGRTPKTDKAAILVDAVRMVTQLRGEAQKLKDSNSSLQEKIKELKAEKIELRDEKQRLKVEKEKLEQQLKAMSSQPSFMPAPPAIPAAFATQGQGQALGNKLMPFIGYPGVAMWQFMPPAAVDTSQDHVLHPPVASPVTAKTSLLTTLEKPLNNPKLADKLKKLKQPRFQVETLVVDDSPTSLSLLAFNAFKCQPIKKRGRQVKLTIIRPSPRLKNRGIEAFQSHISSSNVEQFEASSVRNTDISILSSADVAVFLAPESSQLLDIITVNDILYPK